MIKATSCAIQYETNITAEKTTIISAEEEKAAKRLKEEIVENFTILKDVKIQLLQLGHTQESITAKLAEKQKQLDQ